MRADIADWIALNMVRGIGPRTANQLLDHFKTPAQVFSASAKNLELLGLKPDSIRELHDPGVRDRAIEEIARLASLSVDVIARDDECYPRLLRELCDPPIVLYIKGRFAMSIDRPCIAVVGSRRASTYGVNTAERLARDLASRGLTIVSGLARGIDAAAHRGAMSGGGLTVAVIGTGIEATYPREHGHLASEVTSNGAVISEFPLGTPPLAQNFPYRNRVLSGLSLGVLVVEAAEHSGSLITARLASEQGRDVFAVPGQITSTNAFGPNCLIRDGAKLVAGWQDVVEELPRALKEAILSSELEGTSPRGPIQPLLEPVALRVDEQRIFDMLKADVAIHIDELIEISGLRAPELMSALLGLEMKDKIRELRGKTFVKKL